MVHSFLRNGGSHYLQVRHGGDTTKRPVRAAITLIASFVRYAKPGSGHRPQEGGAASDGLGSQDRADGTAFDDPERGRGGGHRGIQAAHAAAAGRPALCSSSTHRPVTPPTKKLTFRPSPRCFNRLTSSADSSRAIHGITHPHTYPPKIMRQHAMGCGSGRRCKVVSP